jgi:hypothetical protein
LFFSPLFNGFYPKGLKGLGSLLILLTMPHIRVSPTTKKAFDELQNLMSVAFKKRFSQDAVLRELIRSKVELKIDVNIPKQWIKYLEEVQNRR